VGHIDDFEREDYISLTTFRRNGTAVATPVWVARDGDHLYVITEASSGKAKRLRNFSRVMLAPCDMRGRVQGTSVDGTAELLDETESARVEALINSKYGWQAKAFGAMEFVRTRMASVRGRQAKSSRVGIRITLAA